MLKPKITNIKRYLLILLLVFVAGNVFFAQSSQTRYYKTEDLQKEVGPESGKFSVTITQTADGLTIKEIKNLKKNTVILSETYNDDEPYGVWIHRSNTDDVIYDYNFRLVYSKEVCADTLTGLKVDDFFKDKAELGYAAPKFMNGETSIQQYISHNLELSPRAKEEKLNGTVLVGFTVSKTGQVENVHVLSGTHIILDKEAVRVIRHLTFSSPPVLNGIKESFCTVVPVEFKLTHE